MVNRLFWHNRIENAWKERSIVFLSGVRRSGKTLLCQSVPDVEYFDCERPKTRRIMEEPEDFLDSLKGKRIILDEIHRLPNPSELLKIAADHYPDIRILATGSSSLTASFKFRDTLAGRKRDIRFTPMINHELADFGRHDLLYRFLRGGLPPFFLAKEFPEEDFQEWMDAFWSKDIQSLFRLEKRDSFLKFVELMFVQSGGIFEATRFAQPAGVSTPTIANYLRVLEATWVAYRIRPFSTGRRTEIIAAPKVYGFDTGFVCYFKGWDSLRKEDMGILWEHYVLNELFAQFPHQAVQYWRDKQGHEIDFIISKRGRPPITIECKWSPDKFNPANLVIFRRQYPKGDNIVVSNGIDRAYHKQYGSFSVSFVSLNGLVRLLSST